MEIENEVDEVLSSICDQEAQKMETFRLLYDEKASKAMISLERKNLWLLQYDKNEQTKF